jgi:hypothetical protein
MNLYVKLYNIMPCCLSATPPTSAEVLAAARRDNYSAFWCSATPLPVKRVWRQTLAVARLLAASSVVMPELVKETSRQHEVSSLRSGLPV